MLILLRISLEELHKSFQSKCRNQFDVLPANKSEAGVPLAIDSITIKVPLTMILYMAIWL